jgi:hypothetical protein
MICRNRRRNRNHGNQSEDTKEVIRIRKSKKDRQHNAESKKVKRTNNVLQNTTHEN